MNFSHQIMNELGQNYFASSLMYFPNRYLPLALEENSIVPKHVAYLCPICLEQIIFIIQAPTQKFTADFTEDHFPPQSVGGKDVALVCRMCNSKAGHEYDHTLQEHLRHLSFQKKIPNSSIKTQSEIPGVGKFKGKFAIDEKGETLISLKNNESDKIKPLDEWIEYSKTNTDWKIDVHFKNPHDEKIERALIHAAYLTCFKNFGYEFLFSEAGALMRNVMAGLERYCCNTLDLNLDTQEMLEKMPTGLVFISEPREIQSMAVNLKLINKETGYTTIKTILIPDPSVDGIKTTKRVGETLLNYEGPISVRPLYNFLAMKVLPPYKTMWASLLRDYVLIHP